MTPDFPAQRPPVIWSDPADTPEELTYRLKKNPTLYDRYQRLNRKWKGHLSDFLIGKKSLPLTYLFLIPITIRNAYPILFPVS